MVKRDPVRSPQPAGRIGAVVFAHSPHNGEHRSRFGYLPRTRQWIRQFGVSEARIRIPHIPNREIVSLLSKLGMPCGHYLSLPLLLENMLLLVAAERLWSQSEVT